MMEKMTMTESPETGEGRVARVVGPVVDVEFPPDRIPALYNALQVDVELPDQGRRIRIIRHDAGSRTALG